MSTPINDGGPVSLDAENLAGIINSCATYRLSMVDLPPFLTKIIQGSHLSSGGWEQTVTFTAGVQESRALVAYFTGLSSTQKGEKKYTISITTSSITRAEISKEQIAQITKNNIILGALLKEIAGAESTPLAGSAYFAERLSLQIQTIAGGNAAAARDAQYCERLKSECLKLSLRDYFAGQALAGLRCGDWLSCESGAKWCYDHADAMIAERERGAE